MTDKIKIVHFPFQNLHTTYIFFYKLSVHKLSLCKLILHNENQWQLTHSLCTEYENKHAVALCNGSLYAESLSNLNTISLHIHTTDYANVKLVFPF